MGRGSFDQSTITNRNDGDCLGPRSANSIRGVHAPKAFRLG